MSDTTKERGNLLLVVILLLGGLAGAGGAAFYWWRARTDEQQRAEIDRAHVEREQIELVRRTEEDARRAAAETGCQRLDKAVVAYTLNAANDAGLPEKPQDLLKPPFGGPPFLLNEAELLDPWGKPYRFELKEKPDGTQYWLILTTAPDGTEISQFGTGDKARPRN